MNTKFDLLEVGNIKAAVFKKPIKNLYLSVLPPDGKVRISAPLYISDEVIRMFLASKIRWINKQKDKFVLQERQTNREFVSGEDCYFLGKRYRLEVVYKNEIPKVFIKGNRIVLQVRPDSGIRKREEVLNAWYKKELKKIAAALFEKWVKIIGVSPNSWHIRKMKTRWGTCNHTAKRIWLNLELAKKPLVHTEYVVVHEMIHLIEKKHNGNFIYLMDKYLPNWRLLKENLNHFILNYEKWEYSDFE